MAKTQIIALGGGGWMMEPGNPLLDDFILAQARGAESRVCLLPTAAGDSAVSIAGFYTALNARCRATHVTLFNRQHKDLRPILMQQDVIYVSGGNTVNMLAVWHAQGVAELLAEAWRAGVILCGLSAGALCWFETGVTDSYGPPLSEFRVGLGLLPGSMVPHYDSEETRRPTFHRLVAEGLPGGYAADDGAALHFVDGKLTEVVTSRPAACAYRVELAGGEVRETALPVRYLGA
jgi:peptidase E